MTDRDKTIEVIGRVEASFEDLPYAKYRAEFDERAETILTALQASGMAVVAGWRPIESAPAYEPVLIMTAASDVWIASKTPRRSSRTPDAWQGKGSSKKLQPVLWMPLPAASPYGKGVVQEKDDE